MMLPTSQIFFSILCGILLLFLVIELIRQRKLMEQYSVIWIFVGIISLTYALWYPAAIEFTEMIGAGNSSAIILFFGILFCMLIIMQLCVKISDFTHKIKDLLQEISILKYELAQLKKNDDQSSMDSMETHQS